MHFCQVLPTSCRIRVFTHDLLLPREPNSHIIVHIDRLLSILVRRAILVRIRWIESWRRVSPLQRGTTAATVPMRSGDARASISFGHVISSQFALGWLATFGIVLTPIAAVVAAIFLARPAYRRFARRPADFDARVDLLIRDAAEGVRRPRLFV